MKKSFEVDGDKDMLNVVQHILVSQGFDVQTHSTGLNVPDIVMHYHPNPILFDICLPGKLGTEVCKELKRIHTNLPILLFSVYADQGEGFVICDAHGSIRKPFDRKNLIDIVNFQLN